VVFLDSSAFLARLNRRDLHHRAASLLFEEIEAKGYALVTTDFIVAETHALILSRLGANVARNWLQNLKVYVYHVPAHEIQLAKEIVFRYTDKDWTLTDAISFVVMQRLGIRQAFTFDRHFEQFGFEVLRV